MMISEFAKVLAHSVELDGLEETKDMDVPGRIVDDDVSFPELPRAFQRFEKLIFKL